MDNYTYSESEVIYLPVKKILPNPYQPRRDYDKKSMNELAQSIKQYGVLQPVLVRYINKKIYELVNGERRLKATKLAGLETIPALIIYAGDREAAAISLAENLQREDLNYLEEAESMRILKKGFKYSIDEISHIINKSPEYIEDNLRFLNFSKEVKYLLIKHGINRIQATELLKIDEEEAQKSIIKKAAQYKLNNNAFSELTDNYIRQKRIKNVTDINHIKMKSHFSDMRFFTSSLRQTVSALKAAGMETSYEISKIEDNYEIKISIKA